MVETAKRIAIEKHRGQFRRDGSAYISHPAAIVAKLAGEKPEVIAAAWLHDVLEDTATSAGDLRTEGIPDRVVQAIVTLTKTDDDYENYLQRVKADEIARKVKIADMLHDLSDNPTDKQIVKYARGLLVLLG